MTRPRRWAILKFGWGKSVLGGGTLFAVGGIAHARNSYSCHRRRAARTRRRRTPSPGRGGAPDLRGPDVVLAGDAERHAAALERDRDLYRRVRGTAVDRLLHRR